MAQEFVRINRGIKDINKHKKTYSNEGDLFTDGNDLYTLIKNEFVKLTFYGEYLKEIEELKEQIERCCGGVGDNNCNCDQLLTEINKELEKMKNECHSSIDLIDKKVDLLDESLQLLKEKQIKNEEDLTQIQEKIEDIEDELKEIKTLINDLEENNGLSEDVEASLKEINKKIGFMSDDIETLDEHIEDIKKELLTLNDKYLTLDDKYSNLNKKVESLEGKVNNNDGKEKEEVFFKQLTYFKPLNPFIVDKTELTGANIVVSDKYMIVYKERTLILFDLKNGNLVNRINNGSDGYVKHVIIDDLRNSIAVITNNNVVTGDYSLTYYRITYKKDSNGSSYLYSMSQETSKKLTINDTIKKSIGTSKQAITNYNDAFLTFLFDDGQVLIFNNLNYSVDLSFNTKEKLINLNTTNFNGYYYDNVNFNIVKNENDDVKILFIRNALTFELNTILTKEMLSRLLDSEVDTILNVAIHKSKKLMTIIYTSNNTKELAVLKSGRNLINLSKSIKESDYKVVLKNHTVSSNVKSSSTCGFINNVFFYDDKASEYFLYLRSINVNDLANGVDNWGSQFLNYETRGQEPSKTFLTNNYLSYLEKTNNGDFIFKFFEPQYS